VKEVIKAEETPDTKEIKGHGAKKEQQTPKASKAKKEAKEPKPGKEKKA